MRAPPSSRVSRPMAEQGTAGKHWQVELEAWLNALDHLGAGAQAEAERARCRERVARLLAENRSTLAEILAWVVPRLEQRFGALAIRGATLDREIVQEALALQDELRFLRDELAR